MHDEQELKPEHLARMARQHIESLRAAGVEWIPSAPPRACQSPAGTEEPTAKHDSPTLFNDETEAALPPELSPRVAPALAQTPEYAGLDTEQRRHAIHVLDERVSECPRCAELVSTRTQTVFGVGRIDADVCFIGEAPGADEDAQGEPFVGAAGQLLNRIIAACGMKREEVYICNIIKCRPPGNRTPLPQEAANCREYLEKQLELVRPKFICALGACAAQNLLGTTLSVGKLRGRFMDYRGIPVLCTYHPAYLLRNPASKKDVWEDMKKLMQRMGRPVK